MTRPVGEIEEDRDLSDTARLLLEEFSEDRVEPARDDARTLTRIRSIWPRVAAALADGTNEQLRDAVAALGAAINGE